MSNQKKIGWDQYFITMCYLIASKSKDPRTKVGSIIVGPDNEIRSTGYNGLARGLNDNIEERYLPPLKYVLLNHAEENAILNCCRIGASTVNCTIYVPWIPCSLCAKSIIQSGIKKVVYHKQWPGNQNSNSHWHKSINLSKEMFKEVDVSVIEYDGALLSIKGYYAGEIFDCIS